MKTTQESDLSKYKNIDKGTFKLLDEENEFRVFHFDNSSEETQYFLANLNTNYIHLHFCTEKQCVVAINFEHCAVKLVANESSMIYFKDDHMNLLYTIYPGSEMTSILISLEYFHALFSVEGNDLINFSNFNTGKPIIENKDTNAAVRQTLKQLTKNNTNEALRPVFIKGKVYELLSYYFSASNTPDGDHCPYIESEESVSKVKKAKEIIIEEMNNPPSLNDLAQRVGLNVKKLKSDFKKYYGVPVFTFLLNYKMEQAKNLLQQNQMNVNEISTYLGYTTSSHFIAAFKKKYGSTPKQFSKHILTTNS